ncbi:hypothetical protein MTX78_10290 [Hymenobacter tibetensis]|uniref:Uncharacterized protein n=1 Tax=Hymenobacter tibetensis TaxID=497967 RepID=A0ABY4D3G7_9BACT|nr:hypothetical protein [Hymenobacter tibetensis]UOG76970.1 hypothetical protein MTX78_10290 [Hymenobacter tibetensis]
MTMYRFAFTFLAGLLAVAYTAEAQQSPFVQQFAGSTILLTNGDTLRGPVTLRRDQDVVMMAQADGTVTTLSAVAINSFAVKGEDRDSRRGTGYYDNFYDARNGFYYGNPMYNSRRREESDVNQVRVFRTYRWNRGNDYSDFKSPAFFEQLSNGPRILLRRESLMQRTVSNAGPYGYGGYGYGNPYGGGRSMGTYTEMKDDFFLATPAGEIIPLRSPKKDLLNVFRGQAKQLEQYAKQNQLNFTVARELAFIVNYANSLTSEGAK